MEPRKGSLPLPRRRAIMGVKAIPVRRSSVRCVAYKMASRDKLNDFSQKVTRIIIYFIFVKNLLIVALASSQGKHGLPSPRRRVIATCHCHRRCR